MKKKQRLCIIRRPAVKGRSGFSSTTLYYRIKEGTFPPPVSLGGGRAVGWLEHEIDATLAAYAAQKRVDEIKHLINDLVAQRKSLLALKTREELMEGV